MIDGHVGKPGQTLFPLPSSTRVHQGEQLSHLLRRFVTCFSYLGSSNFKPLIKIGHSKLLGQLFLNPMCDSFRETLF